MFLLEVAIRGNIPYQPLLITILLYMGVSTFDDLFLIPCVCIHVYKCICMDLGGTHAHIHVHTEHFSTTLPHYSLRQDLSIKPKAHWYSLSILPVYSGVIMYLLSEVEITQNSLQPSVHGLWRFKLFWLLSSLSGLSNEFLSKLVSHNLTRDKFLKSIN